jgi:hypothetical protein
MFSGASAFNTDISSWYTGGTVQDTSNMFRNAVAFDHDLVDWNLTSAIDASAMFALAPHMTHCRYPAMYESFQAQHDAFCTSDNDCNCTESPTNAPTAAPTAATTEESTTTELSVGAIAGIVVGSVAGVSIIVYLGVKNSASAASAVGTRVQYSQVPW